MTEAPFGRYVISLLVLTTIGQTSGRFNDAGILSDQDTPQNYRLPENVVPTSYDLLIRTHLNKFEYDGTVQIGLNILEKTDTVILHIDKLVVQQSVSMFRQHTGNSSRIVPIQTQLYDQEKQFYVLQFTDSLDPGQYTLRLFYTGEILDDVFGFYRSVYRENGRTKWIGATQFSPTYARRAFPCMDEPWLKARFTIHIVHHADQTVTSNTEKQSVEKFNDNYCLTTFFTTPIMSTYLVGWAVHNFVPQTSDVSQNFRIWTRESMSLRGSIALNGGQAIYSALENWMDMRNPIAKMDQVALPDFHFHAMENWGMITYRESVVLYENGSTPTKNVVSGFTTMSHEFAHTWFGNLVTPRFWNFAWLKEGFATYFQYFAPSLVRPSWKMMHMFVVDVLQPTLLADSFQHNRTINGRDVGSPSSIMAAMDYISYKKGASVIRMISHILGDSVFHEGIRSYIKNTAYKAATPSMVYKHLQDALNRSNQSSVPIEEVVESWTNQVGYPLITAYRNYETGEATLSQKRFCLDCCSNVNGNDDNSAWWVSINLAKKSRTADFERTETLDWLTPSRKSLTIGSLKPEDWLIVNVQQVGYYRVNYDGANWGMLIDHLRLDQIEVIHKLNRAALLDDAFNLARAGYVDYAIPFNLSRYLDRESEYEPWLAAVDNFKFLHRILSGTARVQRALENHVRNLLMPMYDRLGFVNNPTDDVRTKLQRELILSTSCLVNNDHCLRTFRDQFDWWIHSIDNTISPDLKSFVYCIGIRFGGETVWRIVWNRLLETGLHTEYELLLNGLGCIPVPNLINEYLNSSISLDSIRKQYRSSIFDAVLNGNPESVDYTIDFIRQNVERIVTLRGSSFLSKVFNSLGDKIIQTQQITQLIQLVSENIDRLGTASEAANQAISKAKRNVQWIKTYAPKIAAALV